MGLSVRVQATGPALTLSFEDGATVDDLRARIATETGIAAATQEIRSGFPPQLLTAAGTALISAELGGSARILVKGAAAAVAAPNPSGGRKKPQAHRVQNGENPRDAQERAAAEAAQRAAAEAEVARAWEEEEEPPLPAKRARAQVRHLTPEESAAELLGDDAPKPRPAKARGAGSSGASSSTSTAAAAAAAPKARAPKAKTAQQIASNYFVGGSDSGPAARGGGGARDFLTDHGTIEHRVCALASGKFALEEAASGKLLHASFKGVRKEISETVQLLDRELIREVLQALAARGSSSRGRANQHLLAPREMAARSPALLWSLAHAFDGDVERGVRELQG